jgi:hypothetical protein
MYNAEREWQQEEIMGVTNTLCFRAAEKVKSIYRARASAMVSPDDRAVYMIVRCS